MTAPPEFTVDGHVATLTLDDGENRFNPESMARLLTTLDSIENETEATCLVVVSAHEKIYSNGLDLDWLLPRLVDGDTQAAKDLFYGFNQMMRRLLTFPMITIAAINGHAFAAGAIFACALDFRFMQTGRGFVCLPEVDLNMPLMPGMNAILAKAIPRYKLEEMQLTGARLTAEDCEAHRIITKAYPADSLLDEVNGLASLLNKGRKVVAEMKYRLNKALIYTMEVEDVPYIESGEYHFNT